MERFGFNINLKNSPEDILELGETALKSGAYEAIEVTYYEHKEHVDVTAYNQAIKTIVDKYHPQVLVHISAFNLGEENSALRAAIENEIKNCIAYTESLGGKEIVIHSGDIGIGLHVPIVREDGTRGTREDVYEKSFGLSVEMMKRACDLAAEKGMTLYTENLIGQLTDTMDQVVRYVNAVNKDNLKIVFDVGHCNYTVGKIYPEVMKAGSQLKHLHIHDNNADGDSHLPVGEGSIDYEEFIKGLQDVKYDGLYMMELYRATPENLTACREKLLKILEGYR